MTQFLRKPRKILLNLLKLRNLPTIARKLEERSIFRLKLRIVDN